MIEEKEMTALSTSVGADAGQSLICTDPIIAETPAESNENLSAMDELQELYRRIDRMNDPSFLDTFTMQQLYEQAFTGRPPVIDGLLYSGTYLFAGAPKIGKSFFMAQLAYHVSTGQKLWDYDVHQGTVLYLALEDDRQRLQERMYRMFGIEGTEKLHFAVNAKQLGSGLDDQLKGFLRDHPDTKLIIVDTLQKVREMGGEAYSYGDDYQIVGQFKTFADQYGVCIMIVHHTRKASSGDKFEMISGTTGLLGCADGAFVLRKDKRTDSNAILEIVGRDQPEQQLYLQKDEARLLWCLDHAERELWKEPPDPLLEAVSKLVTAEQPAWNGSATELVKALTFDISTNALTKRLNVRAGKLKNEYGISYENTHQRSGSVIKLTFDSQPV